MERPEFTLAIEEFIKIYKNFSKTWTFLGPGPVLHGWGDS